MNPWFLYEALQKDPQNLSRMQDIDRDTYCISVASAAGCACIHAVKDGIDKTLKWCQSKVGETQDICWKETNRVCRNMIKALKAYKEDADAREEDPFAEICEIMKMCCDPLVIDGEVSKKYNRYLEPVLAGIANFDLLPVAVKAVSEFYGKDFWKLWRHFRPYAARLEEHKVNIVYARPESTREFFHQNPDDMVYYWDRRRNICFSESLERWLKRQRKKYDKIMREGIEIHNPTEWILGLMEYAEEEYGYIFTFADFFEETLANIDDQRYLALWKIYERMLRDPEMYKEGSVIFEEKRSETGKRVLQASSWASTDRNKKNNKARITLKRYMALVANTDLRWEVFRL
ncbi:MAG: hypothetical protein LIP12_00980 [Clostridiales bacterium]|nr:hypothetical protein [Clostridiales bacterium]